MNINTLLRSKRMHLYLKISLSIGFALLLVLCRIKITGSFFYTFLLWNLFLAGIPFIITQIYRYSNWFDKSKISRFLAFGLWLVFLPNSPYIITDLIHLQNNHTNLIWLDIFLVFVFAFNGLLLGMLSMFDVFSIIRKHYGKRLANFTLLGVCILSGYGIYLGRFLRFNSWDITTKPLTLISKMMHSFQQPNVWLISFAFGGFLWILFSVLLSVLQLRENTVVK